MDSDEVIREDDLEVDDKITLICEKSKCRKVKSVQMEPNIFDNLLKSMEQFKRTVDLAKRQQRFWKWVFWACVAIEIILITIYIIKP